MRKAGFTVEDIFPSVAHLAAGNDACIRAVAVHKLEDLENRELDAYYEAVLELSELGAERLVVERRRSRRRAQR